VTSLKLQNEHGITVAKRRTAEQLLSDVGPYAKLLKDLVTEAKTKSASDIHIEPTELGIDFRLRVDGNLVLVRSIELHHRESLILEAKRIFGLAIGVSGKPQDGRASLPSLRLDLRVSLLPTHFGEKVVMRLLNLDASFNLAELGFLESERKMFERALQYEDGVIVISGPTGSGKTRTLYALLKALNPKRLNIVTLEDPIEYRIEGLNQVQVNRKMNFADALRSVLRQDPDVILVGEVRDAETAKLCFQAAETGHLVFTTLHANGSLEVIERLSGLGVEKLVLESNLRLSVAQRLEQKLCVECAEKTSTEVTNWFLEKHPAALSELRMRHDEGCPSCVSGIKGRVPTIEWASFVNDGVKRPKVFQSLEDARTARAIRGEIDSKEVQLGHS
jgi:type IV pilus assembly protein PilB